MHLIRLIVLCLFINSFYLIAMPTTASDKVDHPFYFLRAQPKEILLHTYSDSPIILIPFEYKQSALFHAYTFEVIDSVVDILLKHKDITLTIEGYAHRNEGSDTICKYLSLNRAMFVRDYILGRGVDSLRIESVRAMSKANPTIRTTNKQGIALNCRVELKMNYPPTPEEIKRADRDEDGVADIYDSGPDEFGYSENKGCPDREAIIIPFEIRQSYLASFTFMVLDSVVKILRENPAYTLGIEGHAFQTEGINSVCNDLAKQRAEVVKNYLMSRYIAASRIVSVQSFGNRRPLNVGKNSHDIYRNIRTQLFLYK